MIDIILFELPVNFDDFLPNEENLGFRPCVLACFLSILHQIQQTAFEVFEDHYKCVECASAHNKVVYEVGLVHGQVQTYFIDPLLQFNVSEAIELYYLCKEALLFVWAYMEKDMGVLLIVGIENGAKISLKLEVGTLMELEVGQSVQDTALDAYSFHLDRIFAQPRGHYQMVYTIFLSPQGLDFSEPIATRVGHDSSLANRTRSKSLKLRFRKSTLAISGRCG